MRKPQRESRPLERSYRSKHQNSRRRRTGASGQRNERAYNYQPLSDPRLRTSGAEAALCATANRSPLFDVVLGDPRFLHQRPLRDILAGERLLDQWDCERRCRIGGLRGRAVLHAFADVDHTDLKAIAGNDDKAVVVYADWYSSLLRSLDNARRHMIGHAESALDSALVGIFREQRPGDVCGLALVPVAILNVDDLVFRIFVHH